MELDNEAILSDNQSIATISVGVTYSENHIDLQPYRQIVGYGKNASASGRVNIRRFMGAKEYDFLGMITGEFTRTAATGDLLVTFFTASGVTVTNGKTSAIADPKVEARIHIPIPGGGGAKLSVGTEIPWPSIPRYLTQRYLVLGYATTANTLTGGSITAGFVSAKETPLPR